MAARYKKIQNTKYTKKYKLYTANKNPMFSLFRTKCSRTSMTDKNNKKLNTTQSHMRIAIVAVS